MEIIFSINKENSVYSQQLIMSDKKNPFLKDYSQTSLLKKNISVLLINSKVKDNKQVFSAFKQQYGKNNKQNMNSTQLRYNQSPSQLSNNKLSPQLTNNQLSPQLANNPFINKSINAFQILHQPKQYMIIPDNNLINSQIRSYSQNSKNLFNCNNNDNKNGFYKGLQDIGTKQLWKNQLEKQTRYQLKHYGPQILRYQYKSFETQPYSLSYKQQKQQLSSLNSLNTFNKYSSKQQKQKLSKYENQNNTKQTGKFNSINSNKITSQYYGYEDFKQIKDDDDFVIQRTPNKKSSLKKSNGFINNNDKSKHQKHSMFVDKIPQDRNQDFQTNHIIKIKTIFQDNDYIIKNGSNIQSSQGKRLSIQNYPYNYQPQLSGSSGFGSPSQMYESGANFRNRFNVNNNKGGPLNIKAFDDDKQQQQNNQENIDYLQNSNHKIYADTLEYNNKIYYKIQIMNQ